jgi:hypothetical protein
LAAHRIVMSPHAIRTTVQDVCVGLSRPDIVVAQEFLDSADIVPAFEKVPCKGVPKRMRRGSLSQAGLFAGHFHRLLNNRFVEVMASFNLSRSVKVSGRCRKDPLPRPRPIRIRVLYRQRFGQWRPAEALR